MEGKCGMLSVNIFKTYSSKTIDLRYEIIDIKTFWALTLYNISLNTVKDTYLISNEFSKISILCSRISRFHMFKF